MVQTCVVGSRNTDGLEELEKDGTSACGNGGGSQKIGNKGDVTDRIGARNASVEKEESRTTTRKVRVELTLPRNREKEKSVETRETFGQDQGECGDGESPQETQSKHFNWNSIAKRRKSRICSRKILPRPRLDSGRTGGVNPIRETTLGRAVEKHENRLCWWNVDLAKETGKRLEKAEERERVTGSDHSRCFESIAATMFGEAGEVAVVDVLGYEFPGRLAVLVDGDGSESGGCNVLDQVQTYCWTVCDAESVGLCMAQVTPSTEIRECANGICAEDACGRWLVFAVESSRTVSRVAERNCGRATGREESVRPCGPSSGLQGNEAVRCELVFDGLDCAIWSGSCMKARLGTVTSNKVRLSRGLPQGAPESPVIFTLIMELVLRDLIKSWISSKLAWRLDVFTLAAICFADDVVMIAVSVSAAEIMVSEVIAKLKEVCQLVHRKHTGRVFRR